MGKTAAAQAANSSHSRTFLAREVPRPMSRNEEAVYAQLVSAGGPVKAHALLDRLHD
jgi:hypothetical protein